MKKANTKERKADIQAAVAEVVVGTLTIYGASKKYGVDRTAITRVISFNQKMKEYEPIILKLYPTTDSEEISRELRLTMSALNKMAAILGVCKNKGVRHTKRRALIYKYDSEEMVKKSINLTRISAVLKDDSKALSEYGFLSLAGLSLIASKTVMASKKIEDVGFLTVRQW